MFSIFWGKRNLQISNIIKLDFLNLGYKCSPKGGVKQNYFLFLLVSPIDCSR